MLPYIDFRKDASFLEPCAGSGVILELVPTEFKHHCELNEKNLFVTPFHSNKYGYDYLETNCDYHDIIITNPPFSLWREFLEKSLSEADTVVYLLRLNVFGSGKQTNRADFWNAHRPTHIFALEDRPSFTGDGKTDGCDYAWVAWDRGNRIKTKEFFTALPST